MLFRDRMLLDGEPRITADGYLVASARVARTGIQVYTGAELGRPDLATVRVYRPPSEVFHVDSLRSYAHRPVTNDHPSDMVTADNWRDTAVGTIDGEVMRDGEFVRVPLILLDRGAVDAFRRGKRELSMGYTAELVFGDGADPDGNPYDAVQTALRMNHVALVDQARGGDKLRIGDDNRGQANMPDNLRKVVVDSITIETTEQGAQVIERLQGQLRDAGTAATAAATAHSAAIAAKDAELGRKDVEIAALKSAQVTDAQLDERVKARGNLIERARRVHDADYAGKSDAEIRRAAVAARLGEAAVKDRAPEYVGGMFDALVEQAGAVDPVRQALSDTFVPTATGGAGGYQYRDARDNGQAGFEAYLVNGNRGNEKAN